MPFKTRCVYCKKMVELEEGHTSWRCPACGGFLFMEAKDNKIIEGKKENDGR